MKTRLLLFSWLLLLAFSPLAAQPSKPSATTIRDGAVFEKMIAGLEPTKLLRLYRTQWKVKQVTRNRHEPAVRDSILMVADGADKLELFKNKYNAFLLKAEITSKKVDFGKGIRVGSSKAAFCQAFRLSPKYEVYQVTDAPEEVVQLRFTFRSGVLQKVSYQMLRSWQEID